MNDKPWFLLVCFISTFLALLALLYTANNRDRYELRVKELETENKMLREKAKPSLRLYNQPKCNCSCGE